MLALGFLLMIGTTLIADGFGFHVPKGYIYTAMAFSALVEGFKCSRGDEPGRTRERRQWWRESCSLYRVVDPRRVSRRQVCLEF